MLDDIKKTLWATADKLRTNMGAAEYKHLVLSLIFVKYISDTFAARRADLVTQLTNPTDDYFCHEAQPGDIEAELEDRDYYTEVNAFWVTSPVIPAKAGIQHPMPIFRDFAAASNWPRSPSTATSSPLAVTSARKKWTITTKTLSPGCSSSLNAWVNKWPRGQS